MTQLKSFALSTIGVVTALALLGVFASIGLVALGGLAVFCIIAGIAAFFAQGRGRRHIRNT